MNLFRLKDSNYTNQKFNGSALLLVAFVLACFALLPKAEAVIPAPDGGYPGFNTAEGQNSLLSLTTGSANTAVGWLSLRTLTAGSFNTAIGAGTLLSNTGDANTATGAAALLFNTTGERNTATGTATLLNNTTGFNNTANGVAALWFNTTGQRNTAMGTNALFNNSASSNTGIGDDVLFSNTTGNFNAATGANALFKNTTGFNNMANGFEALFRNTTGNNNTADGFRALHNSTTGSFNIALGNLAGNNLTMGSNNIDIGNAGVAGESATVRIGTAGTHTATFIAGIYGATVINGAQVMAGSDGKLGTMLSSARFKEAIKPMDKASEAILGLKPVTFRYKQELDPDGVPQFGLVAEEVEKVSPNLVIRDRDGKVDTVRYEAVNAMLLNEFLKAHRKMQEQEATITQLKSGAAKQEATAAHQQKQIEALTAGLQKVSAQLETSKPAPQVVNNNQ